jgi:hypothetical protein
MTTTLPPLVAKPTFTLVIDGMPGGVTGVKTASSLVSVLFRRFCRSVMSAFSLSTRFLA